MYSWVDEGVRVVDGRSELKASASGERDVPIADIGRGITTTTTLPKYPGTYVPVEEPSTASIAEVATLPGHQQLF
jgi:hypothetical protein